MKRSGLIIALLALLATAALGQGVYIGQADTGNGHAARPAGSLRACLVENTAGAGTLTEVGICLYAGVTGSIRLGVYYHQGSDTAPGYLRLDAGEIINPVAGWNTINGLDLHLFAGEKVWLVWLNSASTDVFQNTAYPFSYRSFAYAALPNEFGPASLQYNRTSLRALIVPDGAPTRVPLTPGFALRPSQPRVGRPIQFTDYSKGEIISWLWDFGDGTTSAERNPVHTYATAGMFEASLTISDGTRTATTRQGAK